MPIGPRIGPRVGAGGLRFGSGFGSITQDASSGTYVPATRSEWLALIAKNALSTVAPGSLWNCQEDGTVGHVDLADAIGSLTLTHASTPSYQQAVSGWTRKGVKLADGTNQQFTAVAGVGPSPATTSQVWLGIFALPAAPAANRAFWGINTGNTGSASCRVQLDTATPKLRFQVISSNLDSANTYGSGNHIVVVRYDRANSKAVMYTDLEKVVNTYSASVVDGTKGFGSAASAGATMMYAAMWSGAAAEAFSDANVKALLQAMNYTISWS